VQLYEVKVAQNVAYEGPGLFLAALKQETWIFRGFFGDFSGIFRFSFGEKLYVGAIDLGRARQGA
jgi:hypothetical protein